jgi:predicted acylesterase/phospholipase RssA/CRP-like cAMP-binding protein
MSERATTISYPPAFASLDSETLQRLVSSASNVRLGAGETLMRKGDPGGQLFVVVKGALEALVFRAKSEARVGVLGPGDLIGEVTWVTGGRCTVTVRAQSPSDLMRLDRDHLDAVATRNPEVLEAVTRLVTERLRRSQLLHALGNVFGESAPDLIQKLAAQAEWRTLGAGEVLFEAGDTGDDWFVIVSGSVVALSKQAGAPRVLYRLRAGNAVGEVALLTGRHRAATVMAHRPCLLARFPRSALESVIMRHPAFLRSLVRTIVERPAADSIDKRRVNLHVAVFGLSRTAPTEQLADQLAREMGQDEPALVLTPDRCASLGIVSDPRVLRRDHPAWLRLSAWLDDAHARGTTVFQVADADGNAWAEHALEHADVVLLVGHSADPPHMGAEERALFGPLRDRAWQPASLLALCHPPGTDLPRGTAAWLKPRNVDAHLHLRTLPSGLDTTHVARLARYLSGRSVGVALSGGGSRGFAHIGVAEVLRQAQIPIDFIAGTSAGALMGALLAREEDTAAILRRVTRGLGAEAKPFRDFTVPMVSLLRGDLVKRGIHATYGNTQIEDLWVPLAIVATDLTNGERRVFERGLLWRAILASCSLPALVQPVVIDGHLFCDGALVDNLPLDVVEDRGCGYKVSSFVGKEEEFRLPEGDLPQPWTMLVDRMFGDGRRTRGVPNIMQILLRATTLSSQGHLASIRARSDLFFDPVTRDFDPLDFSSVTPLVLRGVNHAREVIADGGGAQRIRDGVTGKRVSERSDESDDWD